MTAEAIATTRPVFVRPRRRSRAMANLRGAYIIWYRDVLRWWRDRQRILPAIAQPILYLFVFGVGLGSAMGGGIGGRSGPSGPGPVEYTTFMYPGVLAMSVLFTSFFSAISIVWDREFGFLKEIQVAPISRAAVAVGKTLGGSTVAMLQGSLLLVLAPLVGIPLQPLAMLQVAGLMFLLAFVLSSIGVTIASRLKTMESFQAMMNFILMPALFLSGAFFPLSGLPGWLEVLTRLDPAAYAVDAMRRVVLGSAGLSEQALAGFAISSPGGGALPIWIEVLVLVVVGVIMITVAARSFGQTE